MSDAPFSNGRNGDGRDEHGRFAKGCRPGPGNPGARHAIAFRNLVDEALAKVVEPARLTRALEVCMSAAEKGDLNALKEILNRLVGPPIAADLAQRLEILEASLAEKESQ